MIRFLADADLDYAIVSGCKRREPAIDFLSANDAKLEGIPDSTVLALAAEQDRILVSHDFQTMPRHFGEFVQERGSSPAVFLVKQSSPVGEVIDELVLIWAASDVEEWKDRILEIPLFSALGPPILFFEDPRVNSKSRTHRLVFNDLARRLLTI